MHQLNALSFANVTGVLAVDSIVPVLVYTETGQRRPVVLRIVNGGGRRIAGQRCLVKIVIGKVANLLSQRFISQNIQSDGVDGNRILRREQTGGPTIAERSEPDHTALLMLCRVQSSPNA
jgi:hypothetical protein